MSIRALGLPAGIVLLILGLAPLHGCEQRDLGRFCVVGADLSAAAEEKLNTTAPECESRLCLAQRGYRCADGAESCAASPQQQLSLKPMCTTPCARHSDCAKGDVNINGCQRFVCQAPGFGSLYDGCFCACLDFIRDSDGRPLDEAAFDASDQACGD